jgi:cyclophilin family peptidyl-prolyl cis-trans isomerase
MSITKTLFPFLLFIGIIIGTCSCTSKTPADWAEEKAPEHFKARFETTKGNFEIEAERAWSPLAVDRLYQLIGSGFYDGTALFRVVPGFVVQFGIHNDSTLNNFWNKRTFADEAVKKINEQGSVAFARDGKETRTAQIFINLKNNSPRLDTLSWNGVTGFPGIAQVTSGMEVVESFYGEYGDELGYKQDSIEQRGYDFLKRNYPEIDYIIKAYIVEK